MLTLNPLKNFPLVKQGDNLSQLIIKAFEDNAIIPESGDIVVVAQKVVSKAEGRMVNLNDVMPSPRAEELALKADKDARVVELVLRESNQVVRVSPGVIIVEHKNGFVCANAGIDHSNVCSESGNSKEWYLLLPEDSDYSASIIRRDIEEKWGVKAGVLIIDSHGRAWRNGTVGITIGLSGMPGIIDLRGSPDLFGYKLRVTQIGVADELAAAASLMMGQAREMTPIVHVRGFPYPLSEGKLDELLRPRDKDLFR